MADMAMKPFHKPVLYNKLFLQCFHHWLGRHSLQKMGWGGGGEQEKTCYSCMNPKGAMRGDANLHKSKCDTPGYRTKSRYR